MTVAQTQPASDVAPASAPAEARARLLSRVLEALDRAGVESCILHGYEYLTERVEGDVDMLIGRQTSDRRLAEILRSVCKQAGARLVQWFEDRASLIVLETAIADANLALLQLHVCRDYEIENRLIKPGEQILRSRRRCEQGLWIPAVETEFLCILGNRIAKGAIKPKHAEQLSRLWVADRERCARELFAYFDSDNARILADACEGGNWIHVERRFGILRRQFLRAALLGRPMSGFARVMGTQFRRLKRWLCPESGMHVVFLGPDGVGKSTVIEAVQQRVADAFLSVKYQTFARSLLPNKPKPSPHALPPRSVPASLLKAGWWLACYTAGYFRSVYPTRARGGLAINHRYLIDAIVDPARYRYSASTKLLWAIWMIAPKPDLIVFLDAPADVIWQRKRETTAEETARQCEAYRAMAAKLPMGRIVDTNQPQSRTIEQVTQLILDHMADRIARRRGGAP